MKAIRVHEFGTTDVLKLEEIEDLQASGDCVLVQIKAAGVNPVDTYIRAGTYAKVPKLPYTPGSDAAGIVAAVGEKCQWVKAGDRVYVAGSATGTYAEFCLCDERQVFPLPENVTFEQGAGVFVPYATAFRALFQKAGVEPDCTVLVHGASGAVGIAAVQFARQVGCPIIGTAGSNEGSELILREGANFALDHTKPDYLDEILEITEGRGVDIVIEMLANVNLQCDLEMLAMFGKIVIVGNRGSLDFNPRATMTKDASIMGLSLWNAPMPKMMEIQAEIGKGLKQGYLRPVVSHTFALADAPEAHREIIAGKSLGKIVLIP